MKYKIIGNIDKECKLCNRKETLLVIFNEETKKIIARCDTCKPKELKNDN